MKKRGSLFRKGGIGKKSGSLFRNLKRGLGKKSGTLFEKAGLI